MLVRFKRTGPKTGQRSKVSLSSDLSYPDGIDAVAWMANNWGRHDWAFYLDARSRRVSGRWEYIGEGIFVTCDGGAVHLAYNTRKFEQGEYVSMSLVQFDALVADYEAFVAGGSDFEKAY